MEIDRRKEEVEEKLIEELEIRDDRIYRQDEEIREMKKEIAKLKRSKEKLNSRYSSIVGRYRVLDNRVSALKERIEREDVDNRLRHDIESILLDKWEMELKYDYLPFAYKDGWGDS